MPLDSPSGSGSARHLYFYSCFRISLSAYLQCCRTPTCPWDHRWCFCSPPQPSTADTRGLCGSFLVPSYCGDLSGFPRPPEVSLSSPGSRTLFSVRQAHRLCQGAREHLSLLRRHALFSVGFLFTCLSFLSPPSALWGLCALVLAPLAGLQLRRVCVHCCQLPVSALRAAGFVCPCFVSPACPHCCGICVFLFRAPWPALCATRAVCTAQVCISLSFSLSLYPGPTLRTARVVCPSRICVTCPTRLLGPPSVPEGLYVLARLVSSHYQFPEPTSSWGHSLWAVNGLRSVAFSVLCPLSPCLLCLVFETPHLPLGPACKGASLCVGTPPVSGLPPSLGATGPAQNFSVFPLCRSPSSLLPLFRLLRLFPWRPGVFCCHLEAAWVVPYLNQFLMYLWGGCRSPGLTLLPFSSASKTINILHLLVLFSIKQWEVKIFLRLTYSQRLIRR